MNIGRKLSSWIIIMLLTSLLLIDIAKTAPRTPVTPVAHRIAAGGQSTYAVRFDNIPVGWGRITANEIRSIRPYVTQRIHSPLFAQMKSEV
jgi:hypothetical protein